MFDFLLKIYFSTTFINRHLVKFLLILLLPLNLFGSISNAQDERTCEEVTSGKNTSNNLVFGGLSIQSQNFLKLFDLKIRGSRSIEELNEIANKILSSPLPVNPFANDTSLVGAQLNGATELVYSNVPETEWERVQESIRIKLNLNSNEVENIGHIDNVTSQTVQFEHLGKYVVERLKLKTSPFTFKTPNGSIYIIAKDLENSDDKDSLDLSIYLSYQLFQYHPDSGKLEFLRGLKTNDPHKGVYSDLILLKKGLPHSMAFSDELLYAITDTSTPELVQINLATGEVKFLFEFSSLIPSPKSTEISMLYYKNKIYFYVKIEEDFRRYYGYLGSIDSTSGEVEILYNEYFQNDRKIDLTLNDQYQITWSHFLQISEVYRSSYSLLNGRVDTTEIWNEPLNSKQMRSQLIPNHLGQWFFIENSIDKPKIDFYTFDQESKTAKLINSLPFPKIPIEQLTAYTSSKGVTYVAVVFKADDLYKLVTFQYDPNRKVFEQSDSKLKVDDSIGKVIFLEEPKDRLFLTYITREGKAFLLEQADDSNGLLLLDSITLNRKGGKFSDDSKEFRDISVIQTNDGQLHFMIVNPDGDLEIVRVKVK